MAGDWLEVEFRLRTRSQTLRMARTLALQPLDIVGRLVGIWVWAQELSEDGTLLGDLSDVDDVTGTPGFGAAMADVGWLEVDGAQLVFTKWDEHNSNGAKKRLMARRRMAKSRSPRTKSEQKRTKANKSAPTEQNSTVQNKSKKLSLESDSVREEVTNSPLTDKLCPEPAKTTDSRQDDQVVLEFPTVGKATTWQLRGKLVAEFAKAYPGVDVMAECRKARAWLVANPTRQKTPGGMARYLNNWLTKAQEGKGALLDRPAKDPKRHHLKDEDPVPWRQ